MKKLFPALCLFSCLIAGPAFAGSATWNLNPTNGNWNTATNWTPNTVPDDPSDTATFDASNITAISQTGVIDISEIIFNPGASAFTITGGRDFNIYGAGITNNSGIEQNFVAPGAGQSIHFFNSATAGEGTVFTQGSGTSTRITEISFHQTSSAGSATFINEGNGQANSGTLFWNSATAASGTFINKAAVGNGGKTSFINNSTGGNATIICEGGNADSNYIGGTAAFWQSSNAGNATVILEGSTGVFGAVSPTDLYFDRASAGNATIIANGATTQGSVGSYIEFDRTATADNATLIVNGGTNGGNGGTMFVYAKSTGGTAQLRLFGNGILDLTYHDPGAFSIGSLAGDGMVQLSTNALRVGTNNLTTEFDGELLDSNQAPGGALIKTGSGNLTLTGA